MNMKIELTKGLLLAFILIILFIISLISFTGVLIISGFYILLHIYGILEKNKTHLQYSYHTVAFIILILAVVLYQHVLPGFNNVLIFDKIQVSKDAFPFTMYFNIDKTLVGFLLFCFVIPWEANLKMAVRKAWPLVIITIFLLIGLALIFDFVKVDYKFYDYFFLWALNNLFIVSMAEEVLFRGFLQRHLSLLKIKRSEIIAIIITALVFGVLHWKGGIYYVVYGTIAGVMYGFIYHKSKSIIFTIVSHFVVNVVHIIFFTYPFLQ